MSDESSSPTPKRGRRAGLIGLAGGVIVLGAAYVGAAIHYKDEVPGGTTVSGTKIGGMSAERAQKAVAGLKDGSTQQATVTAGDQKFTLTLASAMRIDAKKTVNSLTGFSLSPSDLWAHVTDGGAKTEPVYTADRVKLRQLVAAAVQKEIKGAAKPGTVKFVAGKVVSTPSTPGRGVDNEAVANDIAKGWPGKKDYSTKLLSKPYDAKNDPISAFAHGDAAKAMSAPLTVTANGKSTTMAPKEVSNFISTDTSGDTPQIKVDTKALLKKLLSGNDPRVAPVDAKVVWKDGKASVTDSKDGKTIDESKIQSEVATALTGTHKATLAMRDDPAIVHKSDIDVNALPTTSISHFESKFPTGGAANTARTKNIRNALTYLNGMVVKPGQQFSLLRALGYDLTKEKGYVNAGTIQSGLHVEGMGGGVSQVSTTVYNTAFFAGVQLDEHTAHSKWIPRYPIGREATLWSPSIDNKWTNDTGHLILIKAGIEGNKVVMDFYGTKKYDVSTTTGQRTNIVAPKVRVVTGQAGCENSAGGSSGFSIDVYRTLKQGGKTVRTEKIHTNYQADDIIRCQ